VSTYEPPCSCLECGRELLPCEWEDCLCSDCLERAAEYRHQDSMEHWARRYDELNGAPEGDWDR
jgi:hypothetical protein